MNRYRMTKAGVDVAEGLNRFNGNMELYEKFLYGFPEDPNFANLVEALKNKDVKASFLAAHALKGVVGNLSLKKLFNNVVPLVEILRAGSLDGTEELMAQITEDYNLLVPLLIEAKNK